MTRGVGNKELADKIGKKVQPAHMKHYGDEQRSIIRQSSLKAAVQLMSASIPGLSGTSLDELGNLTCELAAKFENWVTREADNQED